MNIQAMLPNSLKSTLLRHFRGYERKKRIEMANKIPVVELSERHILNTRVLTNREMLLELLPKGGCVAEVGVNEGDFSAKILKHSSPKKLYLIDVWASDRYHAGLAENVADRFSNEIKNGSIEINQGYSTDVLPQFIDGYFDWVYVDSAHTYEVTRDELKLLEHKVKLGGYICGHDYITSCWRNAVKYGVVEAVHEFCVKNNWEIIFLTSETHQHRSFCIKKIS